ncbi:glycosyltransferase involved in cell wall biosynthesis [Paraburkholderia sp. RAU6.4a]|uniref:methyltransferase domain-containing protein n=1 Tax=Paraburkholderia sp. RAU6.4a TaxID=2991067 RepID=UPI003D235156
MTSSVRSLRFRRPSNGTQFTGERYLPSVSGAIQYEHLHRYLFAAQFCAGKDVLDIASGEGYGAAMLAQVAGSVVGVDIDAGCVSAAKANYVGDNLRFEQGSATAMPLPDSSVDVVTSFETLEHFREHEQFMREVRRVLRPDGKLVISTPNAPVYSPTGSVPNPYHVCELNRDEFVQFLRGGFANIALYGQRASAGSLILSEDRSGARNLGCWSEVGDERYELTDSLREPVYFVALASNGALPVDDDSVLDGSLSFAAYDGARNEELAQHAAEVTRLITETLHRGDEIGHLTSETVRLTEAVQSRDAEIGKLTAEAVRLNQEIIRRDGELDQMRLERERRDEEFARQQKILARVAAAFQRDTSALDDSANEDFELATPDDTDVVNMLRTRNRALQVEIDRIRSSISWRMTKPVRFMTRHVLRQVKARAHVLLGRGGAHAPARSNAKRLATRRDSSWRDAKFIPFRTSDEPRVTIAVIASADSATLDTNVRLLSATVQNVATRVQVIADADLPLKPEFNVEVKHGTRATSSLTHIRDQIGSVDSEFLVLMSDRLAPFPGWLEAMVEAFDRFPDAGAVTGLLLRDDGTVFAAGSGVSWQGQLDGNLQGLPADDSRVASVMRVSAASPGIVMIRNDVWSKVASEVGTEAPFATGFASLALLLAKAGARTYCQPFARFSFVRDAMTIPAPQSESWEDAQQRWQLRERFEADFANYVDSRDVLPLAIRPKIVIVDAFIPKPNQDSGSADLFWYMRIFQAFGYEVCFIAAFEQSQEDDHADLLRRWGFRVLVAAGMVSLQQLVKQEAAAATVVMLQRISVATHLVDTVRRVAPRAKLVFSTVDLHYLREERAAIHQRSGSALDKALEVRRAELHAIGVADATTVVSNFELDIVKRLIPSANVHRIPIPRLPMRAPTTFEQRRGVVFVGGFAHLPNIDAVKYLVDEIWPLVRKQVPDIELQVVGSNVTPEIAALDAPQDGVRIVGFVEDLATVLDHVRLSVAPLRFGAGVKGKVVSSLLHGVPCVLSSVASEGMGLIAGQHILEGETAQQIANEIVRLHEDPFLWQAMAEAGFHVAHAEFSVGKVAQCFREMLESIGLRKTIDEASFALFQVD